MHQPQILKHHLDGTYLITLKGEIDLSNADRVRAAIAEAPDSGTVTVNTVGVTFIDSTGLRALIEGAGHVGLERLHLIPGARTLRLLEVTGLETHFHIVTAPSPEVAQGNKHPKPLDVWSGQ